MNKLPSVCVVLAIIYCSAALNGDSIREKRRSKPNPRRPLTLEELGFECQMHGWTHCRDKTSELLNHSSNTSLEYRRCHTNAATSGVSSLTVDPLSPLQQADDPAALAVDEAITTEKNLPQTSEDESCTLDGTAKETARQHYCSIFHRLTSLFVYNSMEDDRSNRGLLGLHSCVNYYVSEELFTPEELVTSLKKWYDKLVRRHDCCNKYATFPDLEDDISYPCPPTKREATARWDKLLTDVAVTMKKVDLLESLGRRRQCLRGCVGIEEVKCCDSI